MKLRTTLGNTGVELSRLGLGGHTFLPRYGGMDRADRVELRNIVVTAVEEGINLLDVTLDEERIVGGELLKDLGVRDSVFLTCWLSKKLTQTAVDMNAEAERALSLLQLDHVDLFYLDKTCTPEQAEAMVELRDARLTRFIGVLGTETALSSDVGAFDVVLVNHNYYMGKRRRHHAHQAVACASRHHITGADWAGTLRNGYSTPWGIDGRRVPQVRFGFPAGRRNTRCRKAPITTSGEHSNLERRGEADREGARCYEDWPGIRNTAA